MAAWADFYPEVLPHAPGVPSALATNAVRSAAIEFCRYSTIWRADLPAEDVVVDQREYPLTLPADSRLVTMVYAEFDGGLLHARSEDDLDRTTGGYWRLGGHSLSYHLDEDTLVLGFDPPLAITAGLDSLRAVLEPTEDATTCPDLLAKDWRRAVAAGALSELMDMENERWGNPQRATKMRTRFRGECNKANGKARKSGTRTSTRPHFPHFAPGGKNF